MRQRETYSPLASFLLPVALVAIPVVLFWSAATLRGAFYYGDIVGQFYPFKVALARSLAAGQLPLWTPDIMAGYPLHGEAEGGFLYPLSLALARLFSPVAALNYQLLLHLMIAGLGTYAYGRVVGLAPPAAALAGAVFMLSGFLIAHLNHLSIISAAAWLPVLLALAELMIRRQRLGPFAALLAAAIGLQFSAGHAQMTFLSLLAVGLYVLFGAVAEFLNGEGLGRPLLLLVGYAGAVLLGAALAAPQLLHTLELTGLSVRGGGLSGEFFTSFSFPPPYLATFLVPFLAGDPFGTTTPATAAEWVGYVGMLPLVLALYACLFRRDRYTFFFLSLAILALSLAIGQWNPFYEKLANVPVFNYFRVPARYLFLYTFAVVGLAALGCDRLLRPGLPLSRSLPRPAVALLGVVVLALVGLVLAAAGELKQLLALWQILPGVLLVLAVGLVVLRGRLLLRAAPFMALAAALVGADLYAFAAVYGHTFNATVPPAEMERPPGITAVLRQETEPYRIWTHERIYPAAVGVREALTANYALAAGVPSFNGYLPLSLAGYREYAGRLPTSARLANLANVKYVLIPQILADDEASERENLANPLSPSPVGRKVEFPPTPVVALEVESSLSHAADLPDGTVVAEVVVSDGHGEQTIPLRAGIETAEWAYDRPDVRAQVKHKRPQVLRQWPARSGFPGEEHLGNTYVARLPLARETSLTAVEIRPRHPQGYVLVERVVLVDAAGRRLPLSHLAGAGDFELAYRSHEVVAYRNRDVLPRFTIVHNAREARDQEEAWRHLLGSDFDPASEVVLGPPEVPGRLQRLLALLPFGGGGESAPAEGTPAAADGVQLVAMEAQSLSLRASLAAPGYLVMADTNYPGWRVYVDGRPATILRANWLFRAVALPPGEHTVELRYEPPLVGAGWLIAGLATLALLALAFVWPRLGASSATGWRGA